MGSFDLSEEAKASFSVLVKLVCVAVHIAAIPQSPACDVMLKGSVKVQGKRCLFKWLANCKSKLTKERTSSVTSVDIYFLKGAEAQLCISCIFEVIQHWQNCFDLHPDR